MRRRALLAVAVATTIACGYDSGSPDAIVTDPDASAVGDADGPGDDARPDAGAVRDGADDGDAIAACSNGIDDDCDGLIDHAGGDPGCDSPTDTTERGVGLICDDGIDNDGDGLVDYTAPECGGGDSGCDSPTDTTERPTPI